MTSEFPHHSSSSATEELHQIVRDARDARLSGVPSPHLDAVPRRSEWIRTAWKGAQVFLVAALLVTSGTLIQMYFSSSAAELRAAGVDIPPDLRRCQFITFAVKNGPPRCSPLGTPRSHPHFFYGALGVLLLVGVLLHVSSRPNRGWRWARSI